MKLDIKRLSGYHGIAVTSELTALAKMREAIYFLQTHNKNTTKKQDNYINELAAIIDSLKS